MSDKVELTDAQKIALLESRVNILQEAVVDLTRMLGETIQAVEAMPTHPRTSFLGFNMMQLRQKLGKLGDVGY